MPGLRRSPQQHYKEDKVLQQNVSTGSEPAAETDDMQSHDAMMLLIPRICCRRGFIFCPHPQYSNLLQPTVKPCWVAGPTQKRASPRELCTHPASSARSPSCLSFSQLPGRAVVVMFRARVVVGVAFFFIWITCFRAAIFSCTSPFLRGILGPHAT